MAKRQQRRPPQTSDPDAGVMSETHTGAQGDEILDASNQSRPAEADDRGARAAAGDQVTDTRQDLTYDDIAARAYDLWVRRGHAHGSDFDDWLEAERQVREGRRRS